MIGVTLVCAGAGKNPESYFRDACAEYSKRLGAYCRLKITECGEDDRAILSSIPKGAYVFALCIKGKQLSSEELAEKFDSLAVSGKSELCFVIGGSEGFGKAVEDSSDFKLSFSKMTFPHRLMRVILLEQIYRAFTINAGKTYHK